MSLVSQQAIWAPDILPGLSKLSSHNQTYREFRSTLKTPYTRVRLGIVVNSLLIYGYLAIAYRFEMPIEMAPGLILLLGLLQHRLLNVIHEGAHWLLASNRRTNDIFCNLTSGIFFIVDVDQYRATHIEHHRSLGGELDPENNHMDKLDLTWLLSALSGFVTIKKLARRTKLRRELGKENKLRHAIIPLIGLLLHLSIINLLIHVASFLETAIWVFATYFFAPMLGLLRNLLEHRFVESVDPEIWQALLGNEVELSKRQVTTRTFTKSVISRLYGSMGFTRHLLHHWDPSISFINLKKVHDFLLKSEIGDALSKTNSTFTSSFRELWRR